MIAPAQSVVSPYAPTIPQETYKPVPGDPLYHDDFAVMSEHAPGTSKQAQHWRPEAPESSRRSVLPIVLIAVALFALLIVLLLWLL